MHYIIIKTTGPVLCTCGNLAHGPHPWRGFTHGPFNTANFPLRYYTTQKRWPWNREGGGRTRTVTRDVMAAARTAGSSGARAHGAITKILFR